MPPEEKQQSILDEDLFRAVRARDLKAAEIALSSGANVNSCHQNSGFSRDKSLVRGAEYSLICYAVAMGDPMMIECLKGGLGKESSLDLSSVNSEGLSPLHQLIMARHVEGTSVLLDLGANVNQPITCTKLLADSKDFSPQTLQAYCVGYQPIHIAALMGEDAMVDRLLEEEKVSVDAFVGSPELHQELSAHGVEGPVISEHFSQTPLAIAASISPTNTKEVIRYRSTISRLCQDEGSVKVPIQPGSDMALEQLSMAGLQSGLKLPSAGLEATAASPEASPAAEETPINYHKLVKDAPSLLRMLLFGEVSGLKTLLTSELIMSQLRKALIGESAAEEDLKLDEVPSTALETAKRLQTIASLITPESLLADVLLDNPKQLLAVEGSQLPFVLTLQELSDELLHQRYGRAVTQKMKALCVQLKMLHEYPIETPEEASKIQALIVEQFKCLLMLVEQANFIQKLSEEYPHVVESIDPLEVSEAFIETLTKKSHILFGNSELKQLAEFLLAGWPDHSGIEKLGFMSEVPLKREAAVTMMQKKQASTGKTGGAELPEKRLRDDVDRADDPRIFDDSPQIRKRPITSPKPRSGSG